MEFQIFLTEFLLPLLHVDALLSELLPEGLALGNLLLQQTSHGFHWIKLLRVIITASPSGHETDN